jgi:hypothetical protein
VCLIMATNSIEFSANGVIGMDRGRISTLNFPHNHKVQRPIFSSPAAKFGSFFFLRIRLIKKITAPARAVAVKA